MLFGGFNDVTFIRLLGLLSQDFALKDSLGFVLSFINFSQKSDRRQLWYLSCLFMSSMGYIRERDFSVRFTYLWDLSCLFALNDQSLFFKVIECFLNNVNFLDFDHTYFLTPNIIRSSLLLPYERFFLRIPTRAHFILWYNIEALRRRLFNDYVKFHDYLNNSVYLPRRHRLQKTTSPLLFRRTGRTRKFIWRQIYFMEVSKHYAYRAVEMTSIFVTRACNDVSHEAQTDLISVILASKNPDWLFFKAISRFPLEQLAWNWGFFKEFMQCQVTLWSHQVLVYETLLFEELTRMDYSWVYVTYPIFFEWHRISWLCRVLTLWFTEKRISNFWNKKNIQDHIIQREFKLSNFFLEGKIKYRYFRKVTEILVHKSTDPDSWISWSDIAGAVKLLNKHGGNPTWDLYPFNMLEKTRELEGKWFCLGNFFRVSLEFSRDVSYWERIFWRINSNGDTQRDFLDCGLLSWYQLERKLDLDFFYTRIFSDVRVITDRLLRLGGAYWTKGHTFLGNKGGNMWTDHMERINYEYPDGAQHPDEPRWSLASQIHFSAFRNIFVSCFKYSEPLQLIFYILYHKKDEMFMVRFFQRFQKDRWFDLVRSHMCTVRYKWFYRNTHLRGFRRYPNKVCIHSVNHIEFWERWFSFSDRMRRAGLMPEDLPFYIIPKDLETAEEYITVLYNKSSQKPWRKKSRFWIIK